MIAMALSDKVLIELVYFLFASSSLSTRHETFEASNTTTITSV